MSDRLGEQGGGRRREETREGDADLDRREEAVGITGKPNEHRARSSRLLQAA